MKYLLPCDLQIKEPIQILNGSVTIFEEPGLFFRDIGGSHGYKHAITIEVHDSVEENIRKDYLRLRAPLKIA